MRSSRSRRSLIGSGLALFLALSCRQDQRERQATPGPFAVDTFATSATVPFQRPITGVVLPDGRLAVIDAKAEQLFVLRPDGTLDQAMGRHGGGPGEFQFPAGLFLLADTLAVVDYGNRRLDLFLLGTGSVGDRPLPEGADYGEVLILPGGHAITSNSGEDSALALLRDTSSRVLARYGRLVVPPQGRKTFMAMKEQIAAGKIPDAQRNFVVVAADPGGDVWLVSGTEGVIQRFDRDGHPLAQGRIPANEMTALTEAFFAANRAEKNPDALHTFTATFNAVARNGLSLLVALPDSVPPVLLAYDSSGTLTQRQALPGAEGAKYLIPGRTPDEFYAIYPAEGLVFRLLRNGTSDGKPHR